MRTKVTIGVVAILTMAAVNGAGWAQDTSARPAKRGKILSAVDALKNTRRLSVTEASAVRGEGQVYILVPGTTSCGLGSRGGSPTGPTDVFCKEHDNSNAYSKQGVMKYVPGFGNKAVQQADEKLIAGSKSVKTDKGNSISEKFKASAVGGYMTVKNQADKAGTKVKNVAQSVGKTGGVGSLPAFKAMKGRK